MSAIASPLPPRAGRFDRVSPAGVILVAVWVVIAVAAVVAMVNAVDAERLGRYGMRLVWGFLTTLELVGLSLLFGAVLSIPVAAGRLSTSRVFGALAYGYSYFFRGTPLLAQLFLIYYGAGEFAPFLKSVGLWWLFRDAFVCVVLSFTLNTAAYQAEILAGAVRNVPIGQREAAHAVGLHRWATLRKVVLPQALITALRPYGNEAILMIKASAIASIVTVLDLMGQTRFIFAKTYDLSFYLWAAVFYLVTVEVLSRVVNLIERRITRHLGEA